MTLNPQRPDVKDYSAFLASRSALKGAKFGLPYTRCWECVLESNKDVAKRLFDAIELAGGEIVPTDFPCAGERIAPDGSWDWTRGEPSKSEFTVVKVDAYNGINAYLANLSQPEIRSFEDIVAFNTENAGTEGPEAGDVPAFPSGQQHGGVEDETYWAALKHIQDQCRERGIDAALTYTPAGGEEVEFDALLLCDRKCAGQQVAAQAGINPISPEPYLRG
ncbi:MAG: hypothetical protein Q9183_004753 [Haloplaca sp. 2 TL-2023]